MEPGCGPWLGGVTALVVTTEQCHLRDLCSPQRSQIRACLPRPLHPTSPQERPWPACGFLAGLPASMNLPETGITSESLSKTKDLDYCEKVQRTESVGERTTFQAHR